nr:hypothetical protein [Tanacetum cinerariifolium]
MSWYSRCSWCGGPFNGGNCRQCTNVSFGDEFVRNPNPISNDETPDFPTHLHNPKHLRSTNFIVLGVEIHGNSSIDVPNPNSFNDPPNVFTHPPQPQYETYSCELCGNDSHYGYDFRPRKECEIKIDELKVNFNGMSIKIYKKKELRQLEQAANLSTYTTEPSRRFNFIYDDDDDYDESTIPLNDIDSQIPSSIVIITSPPILPIEDPDDFLIMRNEELSTIPEKESDEVINSRVEDFVPILKGKSMTFSNPLFDSSDDFTSSDDESLSDEDVPEDNVKICSNPLFEFDDEYISSDVNPLFDEECFDLGDEVVGIELLLHRDPSTPKMSVASILEGFTNEPPLEENDDLFNLESKENE